MKKDSIQEFLDRCYGHEPTKKTYYHTLTEFFQAIHQNPETYFRKWKELKEYEQDVQKYANYLVQPRTGNSGGCNQDRTFVLKPKTFNGYLVVVKLYLEDHDIELKKKIWKSIRLRHGMKSNKALTQDRPPSKEELRKMLAHASLKQRALVLFLISSGTRIGEAVSVKIEDFHFDQSPVMVEIQSEYSKTRERRAVFISDECRDVLTEWMKVRQDYINTAVHRCNFETARKKKSDDRMFPYSSRVANTFWTSLLKKAGLDQRDKKTNIYIRHLHTTRKFFRSKMPATIGLDMTEELMGHEGYLSDEYRRHEEGELADAYGKGQTAVTIFGDMELIEDVKDLKTQLFEKDKDYRELKDELAKQRELINEVVGNSKRLESLQKQVMDSKTSKHNRSSHTVTPSR